MSHYDQMISEITNVLSQVDPKSIERLADLILKSRRIFLAGAGRSGLMVRCFAMRLMHMGFEASVVGETTTSRILGGDLLMIGSGSGETGSMAIFANKAKENGAAVGLVTIFPDSTIAQLADVKVIIQAPTSKKKLAGITPSIQPLGNLFEQCLLLVLDDLIINLMEKTKIDNDSMWQRHANLE